MCLSVAGQLLGPDILGSIRTATMNVAATALVLFVLAVGTLAELEKECTPGETKQLECNSCFCSQAGVWGCTQMGCETLQLEVTPGDQAARVRRSEGHCVPGTTYTEDSSLCTCNSDGRTAVCMSHSTRAASMSTLAVAMSFFVVVLWNLQILQ